MHAVKYLAAAALIAGFTQHAAAENRTPAALAETITPNYRSDDTTTTTGSHFVWVNRIEGRDSAGNIHVLFEDLRGALLPVAQLHQADRLINPVRVKHKGVYTELQLQLAANLLTVSSNGLARSPLPHGLARKMKLHGKVEVSRFEISSKGLSLHTVNGTQLALLNR
jgi:hypothetical protein